MTKLNLNIKRLLATTIMLSVLVLSCAAQAEETSGNNSGGTGALVGNILKNATPKKSKEGLDYRVEPQTKKCNESCDKLKSCKPSRSGYIYNRRTPNLKATCLDNAKKGGCLDINPVSCSGSYVGIGWRYTDYINQKGDHRNHYGNDIGSNACREKGKQIPIVVYAVADGVVKYAKTSTGGGRTIQIEHKKACGGGAKSAYKSTYRHLLQMHVGVGDTVVKGQPIGLEGGSNAKSIGAAPCDNTEQAGWPGYTRSGCGHSYAIHLHLEIEDGAANGSGTAATPQTIFSADCGDLQVLCGGCSYDTSNCGGFDPSGGNAGINIGDLPESADGSSGGADEASDKQCKLSDFLNSENCLFCGLFKAIFNTASTVAKAAMDGLAGPSKKIVGIGFLIWILVYLFKHVATPAGTSTGEMLKGILFQGFRVSVVVIILTSALHSVMDLTLNPVLQTGLSFAQSLAEFSKCPADADYMQGIKGYDSSKGSGDSSATGGLSTEVGKAFVCSVKNMEDNVGVLMGIGKYLFCVSWHEEAWPGDLILINARLIPHLGYLFNGLGYYLVGLILVLCAPWCLIDCVLQLCIAAGLIPCAIAAFAFKSTEKYLKIIWNFFMNAMFNFVFMAVLLYIINSYMKSWMGLSALEDSDAEIDKTMFIDPDRMAIYGLGNIGGSGMIIAAATGSKFRLTSMGGIIVLGICFLCWSFFDEAKEMAKRFADSPSIGGRKGIGRLVGGTLASAGTSVAKPVLKLGSEGVMAVTDKAGSALNSAVGNKWRSGMNRFKGRAGLVAGRALNRFGGHGHQILNDEGETIGYESSFNILGRRITQKVKKDDSGMWIRETDDHKSNGAERAFEKKFDARGNTEKINLKDMNGNNIKDENGNDVMVDAYSSKHRVLGVTHKREDMDAFLINGKVVYQTADGKRKFTMGEDGEIATYQTRFTRGKEKEAKKHGGIRTVNDGFMESASVYNSEGETTRTKTDFNNETSKYLINNDGTINTYAMAQMQNGAADRDAADMAIINNVLQARGQGLSQAFASRRATRGNDGSFVIEQTENAKKGNAAKKTIITAKMMDNIMVIDTKIIDTVTDKNGKTHNRITHSVSNGMQFKTEIFTQNNKGNYDYNARHGFASHVHAGSVTTSPLDKNGTWGNNVDRDKAMTGFTNADYEQHVEQLKGQDIAKENISAAQMQRLLNTNTADMGVASAVEYENLCRQTEENGIGSQFTTPLENGQTEVISLDSQGIMIKKSFDQEGNQIREFQYNPAENTRKVKTFAAKEE